MGLNLIIGVAGGLISALLFYSAGRGTMGVSLLLFFLTPLPSLIAGLGWGLLAALAAAIAGAVAMAMAVSPTFALGFLLALGVPVAILVHLTYLARPRPEPLAPEWYSIGRLVAALSLYGAALPILVAPLFGGSYAILEPAMLEFVRRFFEQPAVSSGFRRPAGEDQSSCASDDRVHAGRVRELLDGYFRWQSLRRGPRHARFRASCAIVARSAFHHPADRNAGVAPCRPRRRDLRIRSPRIIATSLLGGTTVAFTLAGLSVIHAIAHGARKILLWPLYISMPAIGMYTLAVLLSDRHHRTALAPARTLRPAAPTNANNLILKPET